MLNGTVTRWVVVLLYLAILCVLNYGIARHETVPLIVTYIFAFGIYLFVVKRADERTLSFWMYGAFAIRIALLFSVPNLTEDFYRFLWDGRLTAGGFHPLSHPPSYYIENNITVSGIDAELYDRLNSKTYYSVYPPIAQLLFWICAEVSSNVSGSLLWFKVLIMAADVGVVLIMKNLLGTLKMNTSNVLLYALNPLVLIEIAGNAHYESVMIFLLLLTFYFFLREKTGIASWAFALSVCTKLLPVMFLPAFWHLLGKRRAIAFYVATAGICVILFLPYSNQLAIDGMTNSLGYYFSRFEFNASLYYLAREIGYLVAGFNIIQIAGTALALVSALLILRISFNPTNYNTAAHTTQDRLSFSFQTILWVMTIYLLFATTVHPWYIITLLAISIFTPFRFVILWTLMIFLTYAGYTTDGYLENLGVVALEYAVVIAYMLFELSQRKYLVRSDLPINRQ